MGLIASCNTGALAPGQSGSPSPCPSAVGSAATSAAGCAPIGQPTIPLPAGYAVLTYTLNLSGAVPVQGTATAVTSRRSCSEVDGSDLFHWTSKIGGHEVLLTVGLDTGGVGPGTKTTDANGGGVVFDENNEDLGFNDSGSPITIGTDGSGTLTFSNWVSPTQKQESGTVGWTCSA